MCFDLFGPMWLGWLRNNAYKWLFFIAWLTVLGGLMLYIIGKEKGQNMKRIDRETFSLHPERYELRSGNADDAPRCPYGNSYEWIGFDREERSYVRFSKRLFKTLVQEYRNSQ